MTSALATDVCGEPAHKHQAQAAWGLACVVLHSTTTVMAFNVPMQQPPTEAVYAFDTILRAECCANDDFKRISGQQIQANPLTSVFMHAGQHSFQLWEAADCGAVSYRVDSCLAQRSTAQHKTARQAVVA